MFERIKKYNQIKKIRRELDLLSNRELADIGITRGDIPLVAKGKFVKN